MNLFMGHYCVYYSDYYDFNLSEAKLSWITFCTVYKGIIRKIIVIVKFEQYSIRIESYRIFLQMPVKQSSTYISLMRYGRYKVFDETKNSCNYSDISKC